MAAYNQGVRPACPFCRFRVDTDSEDDMYVLMHRMATLLFTYDFSA